jgi:hypothetical protein
MRNERSKLEAAMRETIFSIALFLIFGCLTPSVDILSQDLPLPKKIENQAALKRSILDLVQQRRIEKDDRFDKSLLNDVVAGFPTLSLDGSRLFFLISSSHGRYQTHEFLCVYDLNGRFIAAYELQEDRDAYRHSTMSPWRSGSIALCQSLRISNGSKAAYGELEKDAHPTAWEIDAAGGEATPLKTLPQFFGTLQQAVDSSGKIVRSSATSVEEWEGGVKIDEADFLLHNTRSYTQARLLKEGRLNEFPDRRTGTDNSRYFLGSQTFAPWRNGMFLEINEFPFVFPEKTMRLLTVEDGAVRVIKEYEDAEVKRLFELFCNAIPGLYKPTRAIPCLCYKKEEPRGFCCVLFDPERGNTTWLDSIPVTTDVGLAQWTCPNGGYVLLQHEKDLYYIDAFEKKMDKRRVAQGERVTNVLDNGDFILQSATSFDLRSGASGELKNRIFSLEEWIAK